MISMNKKTVFELPYFSVIENKPGYYSIFQNDGRGGAVIIMKKADQYVLVLNNRHTTEVNELEFCMGGRDEGETFSECAAREMLEETGYEMDSKDLVHIGFFINDTSMNETFSHVFFADVTECKNVGITDINEITGLVYLTEEELEDQILSNQLRDGISLSAYCKYQSKLSNERKIDNK